MSKIKLIPLLTILISINLNAQPPDTLWQKCYGGSSGDQSMAIRQTNDNGFILTGWSHSNDGDVTNHHGQDGVSDFWVIKTNSTGDLIWEKSFGGIYPEYANDIQQTIDGGYVVFGSSNGVDGDVTVNNGDEDFWIVKLDQNGNIEWQKSFGGSGEDLGNSIAQTIDGGYILAGTSSSVNGDVTNNLGGKDFWIVKLNSNGNLVWESSYGGSGGDRAQSIVQTSDGGYIVAGETESTDGHASNNHGMSDFLVIKLNAIGTVEWSNCLGGSLSDYMGLSVQIGGEIIQSIDGGYLVCGSSMSNDGDVSFNQGGSDYWIVKLSPSGLIDWEKSYGGSYEDICTSVKETTDGGFILAGTSGSGDGDATEYLGYLDFWLIQIDSIGNLLWQKTLGSSGQDMCYSVEQSSDNGIIATGYVGANDIYVSGSNGSSDLWIVKLDNQFLGVDENVTSKNSELIRIVDLSGRVTKFKYNVPLIYNYANGDTKRLYIVRE